MRRTKHGIATIAALSETLCQTGQECASRAELWGKDAEPGARADLVDLVEQIDDVEAEIPFP